MADIMEKLKCRTIDGSLPQGKAKILFVCSAADEAKYADEIASEFFAHIDCSIWSVPDTFVPSADDIEEMSAWFQLVICLLTPRFFDAVQGWPALVIEAAKNKCIPILPLQVEPYSEVAYAQTFDNMQYLSRYYEDPTVIPYTEKLQKYLAATLIDAETAEKIRSAFDAYVFLSYRKKDRKYAQELMRLIHRYPFCRDIAIWYDEFLTPGEDFNDAIEEVLNKCSLFALTVTPNLINEDNFIRRIEYPLARSAQKPVLPLEAVPTDREQLEKDYAGLPSCADPYDEESLERLLREHIRSISLSESSDHPEHLFFIGLAYLEGVDMEIDHQKGVQMITAAAKANLPEAMRRLSSMYETGYGVNRDYHEAAEWQKKLALLLAQQTIVSQDEQLYEEAASAASEYARLVHLFGNDEDAANLLQMLEIHNYKPVTYTGRLSMIRFYTEVAKAYNVNRNLWDAEDWSGRAKYEAGKLYSEHPSPDTADLLADVVQASIPIAWANEHYSLDKDFDLLITLRRKAMEENPNTNTAWKLSAALNLLAKDYMHKKIYDDVDKCLIEIEELLKVCSVKTMPPEQRMMHVTLLQNRGIVAMTLCDYEKANQLFHSALSEAYDIAKDTESYLAFECTANLYRILGYKAECLNDISTAREEYLKGLEIYRQLNGQVSNRQMVLNMSKTLIALGNIATEQKELEEALAYYREALFDAILKYSVEEDPLDQYDTVLLIADTLEQLGRYEEAAEMYRMLVKSVDQYHETDYHRDLFKNHYAKSKEALERLNKKGVYPPPT